MVSKRNGRESCSLPVKLTTLTTGPTDPKVSSNTSRLGLSAIDPG